MKPINTYYLYLMIFAGTLLTSCRVLAANCQASPFKASDGILVVSGSGKTTVEANNTAFSQLSQQVGNSQVTQYFSSVQTRNESRTQQNISTRNSAEIDHSRVTMQTHFCKGRAVTWLRYDKRSIPQQLAAYAAQNKLNITLPAYLGGLQLPHNQAYSTATSAGLISQPDGLAIEVNGKPFLLNDTDIDVLITPPAEGNPTLYTAGNGHFDAGRVQLISKHPVNINFCRKTGECHEIYHGQPPESGIVQLRQGKNTPPKGWLVMLSTEHARNLPVHPQQRFSSLLNSRQPTQWITVD